MGLPAKERRRQNYKVKIGTPYLKFQSLNLQVQLSQHCFAIVRITLIEWLELEGILKSTNYKLLSMGRVPTYQIRMHRAHPTWS